MPTRSTPPPKSSVPPSNDIATYRDLLLFEERLKSNAASLQRRKARYQLFLLQLLLFIAFLLSEVLLPPQSSLLAIPYRMALQRMLPEIYTQDVQVIVHPYFSSGLLFVSVTTLVLFFASGMYSEKIAYANKYVPHANRALRSFNMYLNVRKPPFRSKFPVNPLSFLFPRQPSLQAYAKSQSSTPPGSRSRSQDAASPDPRSRSSSPNQGVSVPIPSIPPASNPRGELIFSSRIDKSFKESYERYRCAFERKREEKEREEALHWSPLLFLFRFRSFFGSSANSESTSRSGSPVAGTAPPIKGGSSSGRSGHMGRRGGSRSGTPPRAASNTDDRITMRRRDRSRSPPVQEGTLTDGEDLGSPLKERERLKLRRDDGDEVTLRAFALERTMSQRISHSIEKKL